MSQYILRRLILMVPTFLGITMVVSLITRIVPGGPLETAIMQQQQESMETMSAPMGGSSQDTPLSEEQIEQLKEHFGLDKPWIVAYINWLWMFVRLDFGESFTYYVPVVDLIIERLPVSAYYGVFTFILIYIVCIPLGIAKALRHKTKFDTITSILTFLGYAVPSYVIAVILMVFLAGRLEWFPLGGFVSDEVLFSNPSPWDLIIDVLYHSILPLISYLMGSFATLTYYMKSYLLEEVSKDYVRTAVSKGVPYNIAVIKHAIRNSIIPMASGFGNVVLIFLGGSFLIEKIFNIDGIALLSYNSIINRDYPVVIASTAIFSIFGLVGNLMGDIIVAIIDPRVKYT